MKIILTALLSFISFSLLSQEVNSEERLDEKIDQITYDWDLEADKLATYEGLGFICTNEEYRKTILSLLDDIHHYDTLLYGTLIKLSKTRNDREVKRSLKDIKKFEDEYNTKSFIHFMNEECHAMREIEKNSADTRNEVGQNSYSGQVYILETELIKYVHHVTARVDKIRQHVHHLSIHYKN